MYGTPILRRRVAGMRHQPWWPWRLLDTMVKPSLSGAERTVVEDKATPRGSTKVAGSRAAAGVATELRGVAVAEAETDGGQSYKEENHPVKHFETMNRNPRMTRCQAMEASDV